MTESKKHPDWEAETILKKLYHPISIVEEAVLLNQLMKAKNLGFSQVAKLVGSPVSHVFKTLTILNMDEKYRDLAHKYHLKSGLVYKHSLFLRDGSRTVDELIAEIKQEYGDANDE